MMKNEKLVKTRDMLTAKQQRFLVAYLDEQSPTRFVASKSAVAAGYSPRTCQQMGSYLLRHPKIHAVIESALADAGISREEIVAKLAAVVRMPWQQPMENADQLAAMKALAKIVGAESAKAAPQVATQVNINLGEEFRELVEERDARLAAADVPPERAGFAGKQPLCSQE